MRRTGLAVMSLGLLLSGCGGGSSPSEPRPMVPAPPVPLEGSWSGSVALTNSTRATCTLSFELLGDGLDFFGEWEGRCPDGTQGGGFMVVNTLFANMVLVFAAQTPPGQALFGGCAWSSFTTRDGNRLRGDFSTPQNCQSGTVLAGRLEMTKQ